MALVSLNGVHKKYPLGKTEVHAVKGVSFDIDEGDFLSIAGSSGSGKSTILNMIGCIDNPTSGTVTIDGQSTSTLPDSELTRLRHRTIGFIFQSFNLIPVLDVYENIEFPLLLGPTGIDPSARKAWIESLVDAVGLGQWIRHKPNELSGGQRQRVAIARALVTKPRLVLADEPTANLDSPTGESIVNLMREMNREYRTTFVFSTHDRSIVDRADRVIRIQDGLVAENYRRQGGEA